MLYVPGLFKLFRNIFNLTDFNQDIISSSLIFNENYIYTKDLDSDALPSISIDILAPLIPVQPNIILSAANKIGACDDYNVNILATLGTAGAKLNITWSLIDITDINNTI